MHPLSADRFAGFGMFDCHYPLVFAVYPFPGEQLQHVADRHAAVPGDHLALPLELTLKTGVFAGLSLVAGFRPSRRLHDVPVCRR